MSKQKPLKKPNKSLIFLKSSVLAFGLVFIVLVIALFLKVGSKNKKIEAEISACSHAGKEIEVGGEIDQILDSKKELIILTKITNKKQELLFLDKECGSLIKKIQFKIQ